MRKTETLTICIAHPHNIIWTLTLNAGVYTFEGNPFQQHGPLTVNITTLSVGEGVPLHTEGIVMANEGWLKDETYYAFTVPLQHILLLSSLVYPAPNPKKWVWKPLSLIGG